jgi:catechol 2,3-dioxygenase-like lactoylglutathione lyase family enzyme
MTMNIRRVMPDLRTDRLQESRNFYIDFLGFEVGMDLGWVVTLVSRSNPTAQLTLISRDQGSEVDPQLSIEVENVDEAHARAVERRLKIVYPLTDEPWGVRRFFVSDPNGVVINVLSHARGRAPSDDGG